MFNGSTPNQFQALMFGVSNLPNRQHTIEITNIPIEEAHEFVDIDYVRLLSVHGESVLTADIDTNRSRMKYRWMNILKITRKRSTFLLVTGHMTARGL